MIYDLNLATNTLVKISMDDLKKTQQKFFLFNVVRTVIDQDFNEVEFQRTYLWLAECQKTAKIGFLSNLLKHHVEKELLAPEKLALFPFGYMDYCKDEGELMDFHKACGEVLSTDTQLIQPEQFMRSVMIEYSENNTADIPIFATEVEGEHALELTNNSTFDLPVSPNEIEVQHAIFLIKHNLVYSSNIDLYHLKNA